MVKKFQGSYCIVQQPGVPAPTVQQLKFCSDCDAQVTGKFCYNCGVEIK